MNVRPLALAGIAAAALVAAPAARAEPVSLQQLLDTGQALSIGGMRFTFSHFSSQHFNPSDILIDTVDRGDGGQGFRLTGNINADGSNPGLRNFVLHFNVNTEDPGVQIVGDQISVGAAAGALNSFSRLNEGVWGQGGERLTARYLVRWGQNGPPGAGGPLEDGAQYAEPQTSLFGAQDGWLFAAPPNGVASTQFVERTFQTVSVPLPTAGAAGLVGLALLTTRRRRG